MADKRTFRLRLLVFAATGSLIVCTSAAAQDVPIPTVLEESELSEIRAGFTIGGLDISLGADLRTYVDGELALHTIVSWEGSSVQSEQWVSDALTPASAAAINGVLSNGSFSMRVNDDPIFLANEGQTALLQRTDGGLQNIVFNTANNTALRQEADISIGIANYGSFRETLAPALLVNGINGEIAWSATAASGL